MERRRQRFLLRMPTLATSDVAKTRESGAMEGGRGMREGGKENR